MIGRGISIGFDSAVAVEGDSVQGAIASPRCSFWGIMCIILVPFDFGLAIARFMRVSLAQLLTSSLFTGPFSFSFLSRVTILSGVLEFLWR